jgi:hypothetical protein
MVTNNIQLQTSLNTRIRQEGAALDKLLGTKTFTFRSGSQVSDVFKHFNSVKAQVLSNNNLSASQKQALEAQFSTLEAAKKQIGADALTLGWITPQQLQTLEQPSTPPTNTTPSNTQPDLPPSQNTQLTQSNTSPNTPPIQPLDCLMASELRELH